MSLSCGSLWDMAEKTQKAWHELLLLSCDNNDNNDNNNNNNNNNDNDDNNDDLK